VLNAVGFVVTVCSCFVLGPNLQNIVRQIYDTVTTYGRFTTSVR